MNNSVLNGLQLYRTKWFSGLVDENMLSNALVTHPYEVTSILSYIFGAYENSTIDFLTSGLGRTLEIANRQYTWPIMIDSDKAVKIKDAKWMGGAISETSTPGINLTPIQVWVSEAWFGPGAIVAFDDREFQARVMGEPYQDGSDYVYTLVVANGKAESFIPPSLLEAGVSSISREGSAYEEYSEEADIVNYNTPFQLRNHLTTMRLSYDITGDAYSSVMVIALKNPKTNKSSYLWSDYQEWRALRQWYQTIDRFSVYSQYNANQDGTTNVKGTNGRPVYVGAGLLEQISPANKETYTKLTVDLLEDFLFNLSYNILGRGERKFVALTGEMGMKEFDRVIREKASAYNLIDTKFISGTGQELTLGGQFVTYKMLNGIELTLKHFPLYDNTVYNRKLHPVTGKPLESYRMTFCDFGMRDGESNIKKVVRKDREMVMWHTGGSVTPAAGHSKSIGTLRSNAKDGYSVHFLSEQGIMVSDPTTSGELIMDVE
ncbi:MAG: hypothetical protein WDK95_08190 [Syntrophorhabdaceae bacterium]